MMYQQENTNNYKYKKYNNIKLYNAGISSVVSLVQFYLKCHKFVLTQKKNHWLVKYAEVKYSVL